MFRFTKTIGFGALSLFVLFGCGSNTGIPDSSKELPNRLTGREPIREPIDIVPTPDVTPPPADLILITSPEVGESVSGIVAVNVSVNMAAGVDHVEFYLDHWATYALKGSLSSPPFQFALNTIELANGTHTLGARAYDTRGNMIQEAHDVVVANIEPTPAPTDQIAITFPGVHSSVSGTVLIQASVYMAAGIDHVEFYLDHWATYALMGSVSSAPYQISWNTAAVAAGVHTLGARAYDKQGHFIQEAHDVVVGNEMAIVSPLPGAIVSDLVTISATASMPVGVDHVEFYKDHWDARGYLGSVSSVPFEWVWDTNGLDNGLHTIGVRAYDKWGNLIQSAFGVDVENDVVATWPPNAPILFFAGLQGPSTIHLSWVDVSSNEQSFVVERAVSGGPFGVLVTLPGNSTSYDDTGLAPATTYQYRVKAANSAGSSPYTAIVTRTTP